MKNKLIIIEGPDYSGKSTLARHLASLGYVYLHSSHEGRRSVNRSFDVNIRHKPVVMDRCWLSGSIYGPLLRAEGFAEEFKLICEDRRMVERHDPLYIFCKRGGALQAQLDEEKEHRYNKRLFKKIIKGYEKAEDDFMSDLYLKDRTLIFQSDKFIADIPGWLSLNQLP